MWNSTVITEGIKKISAAHAFWFMMLCATFGGLYLLISPITRSAIEWSDCLDAKEEALLTKQQLDIQVKNRLQIERALDSVKVLNATKEAEIAEKNRKDILTLFIRTKYQLPHVETLSYWSMHNGGETMNVESRRYLEVYISSDDEVENRWRKPEPIPRGVQWLSLEALNKPYFLIKDVSNADDLYKGETKILLNQRGVKSVLVLFIKNVGTDFYYVSIDFSVPKPTTYIPDIISKGMEIKRFVQRKSNVKKYL